MAEWVLNTEYKFGRPHSEMTLPAGSFVCPVATKYLPDHIPEKFDHNRLFYEFSISRWTTPYTFCYTRYGLIPIPDKVLRKIR